jgi:hypothetical protein
LTPTLEELHGRLQAIIITIRVSEARSLNGGGYATEAAEHAEAGP